MNRPSRSPSKPTIGLDAARCDARDTHLIAGVLYLELFMSAIEGPVRFGLNLVHLDAAIFVRDFVIAAVVLWYIVARVVSRRIPASIGVFAILFLVHGAVSVLNLRTIVPSVYELKILLPGLAAFLAPDAIFRPTRRAFRFVLVLWIVSVAGATYDQLVMGLEDFPWIGLNVSLGGIETPIGRDWQAGAVKRVGGLTRSSINLAIVLPVLSFMLLTRLRKMSAFASVIYAVTVVVLVWTTQKGSILGFGLAVIAYLLSASERASPLKFAVGLSAILLVFIPVVLPQFTMPRDQGVFSLQSFIERIEFMWPLAWDWINRFPPLLGVGLGGIGGGQRFFAPKDFNPADNLFIYLYANFGVAAVLYLVGIVQVAATFRVDRRHSDLVVLGALTFLLFYGLVISLIEDQIAIICFGAVLGYLTRPPPRAERFDDNSRTAPA